MIWAIKENQRIKAIPKETANCPSCKEKVISKCGKIKIWHWAHKQNFECDSFGEPESEWHLKWKNHFPKKYQEVIIKKTSESYEDEIHIADIRTKEGVVIELQNSPISSDKIEERENFYKKMIWILNGKTLGKNLNFREKSYGLSFRWKWFPKSWEVAKKIIYIDFSDLSQDIEILQIKRIYFSKYVGGWGKRISKRDFLKKFGGNPWQT